MENLEENSVWSQIGMVWSRIKVKWNTPEEMGKIKYETDKIGNGFFRCHLQLAAV